MSVSRSDKPWWIYVLALVVILVISVGYALVKTVIVRTKQTRLRKKRSGSDFQSFQLAFEGEQIPLTLLESCYKYFREYAEVDNFPVSPEDDICDLYELDEEEFSELIRELREQLHCREPNDAEWEIANGLKTVADMVRFIAKLAPKVELHANITTDSK